MFIVGCALVLGSDGKVRAAGPRGKAHKGAEIATRFVDPEPAGEITKKASEIYQLFTGRRVDAA